MKLQRLCAGLLVLAAAASPASAGNGRWTPFGPPQGQPLTLAVHPSGHLFAAARYSGMYRSTDGGRTWSWSGVGMAGERIGAVAADLDDGDLYAVGEARFFRSTDGGATWAARPLPVEPAWTHVLTLAPGEPDVLFLARGGRLFRSEDQGGSWEMLLAIPAPIASVLPDPGNPRSLLVGTWQESPGTGLYRSADGGATWAQVTRVRNEPPAFPGDTRHPFERGVLELAAVRSSRGASRDNLFAIAGPFLFRSTDGGASWHKMLLPAPSTGFALSVAVRPGPRPVVYVLGRVPGQPPADFGLFVSRDLGNTWKRIDRAGVVGGHNLQVDPATGDLYMVTWAGIARGAGDGTRWSHHAFGNLGCQAETGESCGGRLRFQPGDESRLWAVAGSLWTSGDRGRSWTAVGPGPDRFGFVSDVALDPQRRGVLYASSEGGLFGSTDVGRTWTRLLQGVVAGRYYSPFVTVAAPASREVLGGGCGIWLSQDGGAKWKQTLGCPLLDPDDPNDPYNELRLGREVERFRVDPRRPQVIYAEVTDLELEPSASGTHVYRSTDGGRTWRHLLPNARAIAIDPTDPQILYALQADALLQSRDDGRIWSKIGDFGLGQGALESPAPGDLAVDPSDPRLLWAARSDGVWRSKDGGATWVPLSAGLRGPARDLFLDPSRPGHLYVGSVGLWEAFFP